MNLHAGRVYDMKSTIYLSRSMQINSCTRVIEMCNIYQIVVLVVDMHFSLFQFALQLDAYFHYLTTLLVK